MSKLSKKYIKTVNWSGEMKVDGGWGPKETVLNLFDQHPEFQLEPILDHPNLDFAFGLSRASNETVIVGLNQATIPQSLEVVSENNYRYSLQFNGKDFELLEKLLFTVLEEAKTIEASFHSGVKELLINAFPDNPGLVYRVAEGTLKPDFSEITINAGWTQRK